MDRRNASLDSFGTGEDPPTHLVSCLDAIYDSRKLIAALTAGALLLGIAYAFLSEPVYRSDILVQVEENANTTKNPLGDLSAMFDVKTAASGEMQVIGSRMVVGRAVEKLKLFIDASPRYFPLIGRWTGSQSDGPSAPGPFGYVWGKEHIDVSAFNIPPRLYERSFTLTKEAGRGYALEYRDIKLHGTVGETLHAMTADGPIELLVDRIDANPGATFALRRFSQTATIETLRRKLTIAERGKESDVIGVTLDGTDPQKTSAILNAIGSEYLGQNLRRKAEDAEQSIKALEMQLPALKKRLASSEDQFNAYRATHGTVDLGEEATTLLQRSVEAQTRLVALQQKRRELLSRYADEHPAIRSIDAQLQIAQDDVNQISRQAHALPLLEQNVLRLQRDVQVDSDLYTTLRSTLEQLRLVKAGKVSNVRLVDMASVPEEPIRPQRALVVAASLVVGLLVGVAAALTRRQLFDAIDDPHEIERLAGLPVYASIPYSRQEEQLTRIRGTAASQKLILASASSVDPAVESLRGFRNALEFTMLEARNRLVLITGPSPGVGKSFIALNLAAVLGASGRRVLLVDGDLRRGFLHRHLGGDRGPGLSDLIQGSFPAQALIRSTALAGVDFLPAGGRVPNPSDLLSHANLHGILTPLAANYDVVLFDGPPILPVADASPLASLSGTTFLVARQGVTGVGEVRESARRLAQIGLSVRGVIVNGLRLRPGRYSYGYGRYRYAGYDYLVQSDES